jgi:CubicO group peptidase (beta-lactamase class C family)
VGSVWETLRFAAGDQLAATANEAKRLYPQDSWFHYSNLGFALLGELAAQIRGTSWGSYGEDRVLLPLGMRRATPLPGQSAAQRHSVTPYTDEVVAEPLVDCLGLGVPAAQLWSSAEDLCRWTGAHYRVADLTFWLPRPWST